MALKGELDIVDRCPDCGGMMPVQVCLSGAGYYIGQQCDQCGSWSRLSARYYGTRKEAQDALDHNTYPKRDVVTGKVAQDIHGSFEDCSPGIYIGNDLVESIISEYLHKTVRVTIEEIEPSPIGAPYET